MPTSGTHRGCNELWGSGLMILILLHIFQTPSFVSNFSTPDKVRSSGLWDKFLIKPDLRNESIANSFNVQLSTSNEVHPTMPCNEPNQLDGSALNKWKSIKATDWRDNQPALRANTVPIQLVPTNGNWNSTRAALTLFTFQRAMRTVAAVWILWRVRIVATSMVFSYVCNPYFGGAFNSSIRIK